MSIILSNLGCENKALGFIAGFTGDELEKRMQALGCQSKLIRVEDGMTRINVKIHADQETEINGQGSVITEYAMKKLYKIVDDIHDGDTLVLSGSVPKSVSEKAYENLLERIKAKQIRVVVDVTKDMLLSVLKYHPFLVKPNKQELENVLNQSLASDEEVIKAAKCLQEKGASSAGDRKEFCWSRRFDGGRFSCQLFENWKLRRGFKMGNGSWKCDGIYLLAFLKRRD